jgi:UDP-2,3-diacylglucosamine hydrolase
MKAVFFSDAHLLDNEPERAEALKTFMREVTADAEVVVILGDLFEFYHGHEGHIYPCYREIADLLRDMARTRSVYLVEGNHEFDMGDFFESHTGVRCVKNLSLELDGQRVFLSHGDEVHGLPLRRILKSRFIYGLMNLLGPERTWRIAMQCRRFLSKKEKPHSEKILVRFRGYGKRKLREGYDAVVFAHSHMADMESYDVNGRKKVYMNTGGLIASSTYGVYITGKGFTLTTYDRRV